MTATGPGAGPSLDLVAKFGAHIGKVDERTERIERFLKQPPQQPVYLSVYGSGVNSGLSSTVFIRPNIDSPAQGHLWFVRRSVVSLSDPSTTDANVSAYFYVTGAQPVTVDSLARLGVQGLYDKAATLPGIATYSDGAVVVGPNDGLLCVITGAVVGHEYDVSWTVQDVQEAAIAQSWNIG